MYLYIIDWCLGGKFNMEICKIGFKQMRCRNIECSVRLNIAVFSLNTLRKLGEKAQMQVVIGF